MARQSQKTLQDEKQLRDQLHKFLLVEPHSYEGRNLATRVLGEIYPKPSGHIIKFEGDPLFSSLIRDLFEHRGIRVCDASESPTEGHDTLYVPRSSERKADIPAIVSFMVHDFINMYGYLRDDIPKYICGETILSLLMDSLWIGFDDMQQWLHSSLKHDWRANHDTITLRDAIILGRDAFQGKDHLVALEDIDKFDRETRGYAQQYEIDRDKTYMGVMNHLLGGPQSWNLSNLPGPVPQYVYADLGSPGNVAFPFPLVAVCQAMQNIQVLLGDPPECRITEDDHRDAIARINSIRCRQSARVREAEYPERLLASAVSHSWDVDAERRAVAEAALCEEKDYDSFMANLHYNWRFPHDDTVYDTWKSARGFLFDIGEKHPGGDGTELASAARVDSQRLVKELMIIEDDFTVICGHEKYFLTERYFKAVKWIAESHWRGNPCPSKHVLYSECDITKSYIQAMSVRKWFINGGGESARFARDGLIKSCGKAGCRIPISADRIMIVPSDEPDSTDD